VLRWTAPQLSHCSLRRRFSVPFPEAASKLAAQPPQ
jgi:hypothetical protein